MAVSSDPRVEPKRDADFRCAPAAAIAFENRGLQERVYASFAVVTLTIVSHASAERRQRQNSNECDDLIRSAP
jgi:hypothetical protein